MKMTGNTILMTGGGSGIGRALAERFRALGNEVIVAGRRQAALDEVAAGCAGIRTLVLDVADPASIAAAAEWLAREAPALNVLVNNAGIMAGEDLAGGGDGEVAAGIVETNILGPMRLTAALLPQLRGAEEPVVVTVSSGLAFVPKVDSPTYSASKAFIHSWTVSLRAQLQGAVEVIELVPPGVQTDLTPGQATREGYLPLDAFIDEVMTLWGGTPTPSEITVQRVLPLRRAEAEGRFAQALAMVNGG